MDFKERKQKRIEHFEKYVKGWKQRPCTACNGSGYYDNNGFQNVGLVTEQVKRCTNLKLFYNYENRYY